MVHFCYLRPYLGIESVSCCRLQWDGKGGHGLKRRAVGPTFSRFNAMPQTTTATLETEKSGRCREVLNKSQCMDFFVRRDEK